MVALGAQGLGALRVTQSLDDAGEVAEQNDKIAEGFGRPQRIREIPGKIQGLLIGPPRRTPITTGPSHPTHIIQRHRQIPPRPQRPK